MAIAMYPHLMACINDSLHLLREGLDTVAGNEPGRFQVITLKELKQAWRAHFTSK